MQQNKCFPLWLNYVLVILQKKDWRGKHRLYVWLSKHFAHKVITHKIDNRPFSVPVGEWCFWLEKGPENYYLAEFLPFCDLLNQLNAPFTLFDLGADIGTVSSLVSVHSKNLKSVVAFEPNPQSFEVLKTNLGSFTQQTQCVPAAVSNYEGFASFHAAPDRLNDHEGYIDENREGDTVVTSLDSWQEKHDEFELEGILALKIDVEGQESQLLLGAQKLMQQADKVILLIEIHPEVLARTNDSPEDLFAAAEQCRDFDWTVPLYDNKPINRKLSFFEQVPMGQYDIIGVSR
jgi:FkbM family methyltransferase